MLKLVTLNNPRLAQSFIDYMAYRGIELHLETEEEGQLSLWLPDLQHQVDAEAELHAFLQNPYSAKYQSASWDMAETRKATFTYSSVSPWQQIKKNAQPFTSLVMIVCICTYLAMVFGLNDIVLSWLHFPAAGFQRWEIWRLFSHAFMHFSAMHIIFNLLWWWVLGSRIEMHSGSAKLLQIFLLSALFSGLGQYQFEGPAFGGLSGVVYALLGYLWMANWLMPERGLRIENGYVGFMLIWLVIGFAQPFGQQIANLAHLFGLLTGVLLGVIDSKRPAKQG